MPQYSNQIVILSSTKQTLKLVAKQLQHGTGKTGAFISLQTFGNQNLCKQTGTRPSHTEVSDLISGLIARLSIQQPQLIKGIRHQ